MTTTGSEKANDGRILKAKKEVVEVFRKGGMTSLLGTKSRQASDHAIDFLFMKWIWHKEINTFFFFLLQTVVNWANFLASFKKRKPLLNRKIFSLDSFGLHSFGPQLYRIQSEEFPSHLRTLNWLQLTFIVAEYSIAFAIISCTSSHSFACTQIRFQ